MEQIPLPACIPTIAWISLRHARQAPGSHPVLRAILHGHGAWTRPDFMVLTQGAPESETYIYYCIYNLYRSV